MFYQLHWQQTEKNWKVICSASFCFIVTHYSIFGLFISVSSSPTTQGEKGSSCNTSEFRVCFSLALSSEVCHPKLLQKSNYSWMSSVSSAFQCKDLRSDPQPLTPWSSAFPGRIMISHKEWCPSKPLKALKSPIQQPPCRVKIKFCFHSWLVGGAGSPSLPPLTVPAWMPKVIPEVCRHTWGHVPFF